MFILKGGEIWDGLGGDPYRADLLVDGGKIVQIAREINCEQAQQIDVEGCMILPGFGGTHRPGSTGTECGLCV